VPQHSKILLVIADGEHVRFVRPDADNGLHSDASLDSFSAHQRSAELGSDRPGASFHSGSSVHHALAPRHDPHLLEKEKFARAVAAHLNDADVGKTFDELVIVAPPHTLNVIRGELRAETAAKLVGVLQKDLVKTPDDALWPHVSTWVRPVHRAAL